LLSILKNILKIGKREFVDEREKDRNGGIKTIQIGKGETIERLKPEDEGKEKRLKPYNQPDGCRK
jgi:hypothetical protein